MTLVTGEWAFEADVWVYDGQGAWRFVTVPREVSDEIEDLAAGARHGFGSVRVEVTVGGTTWRTSVFPDKGQGAFILPLKKAVRAAEAFDEGDRVTFGLRLID